VKGVGGGGKRKGNQIRLGILSSLDQESGERGEVKEIVRGEGGELSCKRMKDLCRK